MEVRVGRNSLDSKPVLLKSSYGFGIPSEPKPPLIAENGQKVEQDKINNERAKQEVINLLLLKANEFNTELHNVTVKSKELQAKIQRDINSINLNKYFMLLVELRQKKESSINNLISELNKLKQELAEAKALVAKIWKHSKDPATSESSGPQNSKENYTKLQSLSSILFCKTVQIKWISAELKTHFQNERLQRETLAKTLATLNVNMDAEAPNQSAELNYKKFDKSQNPSPASTAWSLSNMLSELNSMVNQVSKPSCRKTRIEVPICAKNPLPTFKPEPADAQSETSSHVPANGQTQNTNITYNTIPKFDFKFMNKEPKTSKPCQPNEAKSTNVQNETMEPWVPFESIPANAQSWPSKPQPNFEFKPANTVTESSEPLPTFESKPVNVQSETSNPFEFKPLNVQSELNKPWPKFEFKPLNVQSELKKPWPKFEFKPVNTQSEPSKPWPKFEFKPVNVQSETSNPFEFKPLNVQSELNKPWPKFEFKPLNVQSELKKPWPKFEFKPLQFQSEPSKPMPKFEFKPPNIQSEPSKPLPKFEFKPLNVQSEPSKPWPKFEFKPPNIQSEPSEPLPKFEFKPLNVQSEPIKPWPKFEFKPANAQSGHNLDGVKPTAPNTSNSSGLGTTRVRFKPVVGSEFILKSGVSKEIITNHQCITVMKEYQNKSLEELRLQDYVFVPFYIKHLQKSQSETGTTLVRFKPVVGKDFIIKHGTSDEIKTEHQCITIMKEYEDKSLEELRLEDYVKAGRIGMILFSSGVPRQQLKSQPWPSGAIKGRVHFKPVVEKETILKSGVTHVITGSYQCITLMKEYDYISLEELRLEDYQLAGRACESQPNAETSIDSAKTNPAFSSPTVESKATLKTPQSRKTSVPKRQLTQYKLAENDKDAGDRYYEDGKLKEAVVMFTKAIERISNKPEYWNDRARALMELGKFGDALEDARKSVDIDPKFAAGYICIAKCCLALGKIASGEQAARRANEIMPYSANILLEDFKAFRIKQEDATLLMEQNKYYDALSHLNSCLKNYNPACSKTKLMKAECLANLRFYRDARNIAFPFLSVEGFDADATYIIGLCSHLEGNDEQAVKYIQKVLQTAPDHGKALKVYKKIKTRKNEEKLKQKKDMGNEAFKRGNFQRALELYNEALTIDKTNKEENAKLHYNRATVFAKLNQTRNAASACTAALELDDNYVKALLRRAQCYTELEQYEEAVEDYEKLNIIQPTEENKHLLEKANSTLRNHIGKNYHYKILGVVKTASKDDIKKAFRDRALLYHPDKHAGSTLAVLRTNERKFKQVKEAYDILSDPVRRANYDRCQKFG